MTTQLRCALLLLVAWPGPLPVMHSHTEQGWETGELERHVALFHTSPDDESTDPHCHWVFRWEMVDEANPVRSSSLVVDDMRSSTVQQHRLLHIGLLLPVTLDSAAPNADSLRERIGEQCAPAASGLSGLAFHQQFCIWIC